MVNAISACTQKNLCSTNLKILVFLDLQLLSVQRLQLAPGLGTVVGGMVGASGKKKGTINSTSVTTQEEKPGSASILLRNIVTGEIKTISTKLTQAQANNIERFFE